MQFNMSMTNLHRFHPPFAPSFALGGAAAFQELLEGVFEARAGAGAHGAQGKLRWCQSTGNRMEKDRKHMENK